MELEFISERLIELGDLSIRAGPDDILKTYQREMSQFKLRLEVMMEMTDCKENSILTVAAFLKSIIVASFLPTRMFPTRMLP